MAGCRGGNNGVVCIENEECLSTRREKKEPRVGVCVSEFGSPQIYIHSGLSVFINKSLLSLWCTHTNLQIEGRIPNQ